MRTKNQFSIDQQQTLFAPDLTKIEEENKKKIYFFKRFVYDRMKKIVIDRVEDLAVKRALLEELESILQMKNDTPPALTNATGHKNQGFAPPYKTIKAFRGAVATASRGTLCCGG